MKLVIVALLFLLTNTYGKDCCRPGEAIAGNGTCTDDTKIQINVTCEYRILLTSDQYVLSANGTLIALAGMDELIPENKFCLGKYLPTNENISVVCFASLSDNRDAFTARAICALLSVVFLIVTITVYLLVPKLRDLQGKCILCSMVGLTLAFISLSVVQLVELETRGFCLFWAFSVYFTFLVAFFWLNIVSINMWRKTVLPNLFDKSDHFWFTLYLIYGFGGPSIFLVSTVITHNVEGEHLKPGFGDGVCFLNAPLPIWGYFYGPIATLLTINLILFIWSSVKLWLDSSQQSPRIKNLKYKCLLTLKLCLIMGVPWIFEVLSFTFENVHRYLDYLWTVTDYINALQGLLIFMVLVLFRKKALRGLASNSKIGSKFPKSWERLDDGECTSDEETLSESK